MKTILIYLSVIFLFSCGTESVLRESIQYQKETEVKAQKELIANKSVQWLADYYEQKANIIQNKKNDRMKIISNRVILDNREKISCTLNIDIQDNKIKVTYKNITQQNGQEVSQILLKKLEPRMNTAIYNLQQTIISG